tara:strand:- start:19363 stop:21441 length:2079 start_codon:yes stop_codon:yes gene_type:complete
MKKALACLITISVVSHAQASDYGTTGIIDMPNARMQEDGTLSIAINQDAYCESYAITYQALPWLEATFRYSGFQNDQHWDKFIIKQEDYWDRNYGLKIRLMEESSYLPEVAFGIRDLVGSGLFGSEYIVASKSWKTWDFSLGMGWGRMSNRGAFTNPLGQIDNSFFNRPNSTSIDDTGKFRPEVFFSGENVGIFGGIQYRFDNYPFTLSIEYNTDEYRWERLGGLQAPSSALSYGVKWHLDPDIDLQLTHQHLDTIGLGIKVRLNTFTKPKKYQPPKYVSSINLTQSQMPVGFDATSWYDRFLLDMERASLFVIKAQLEPTQNRAVIEIANESFPYWPDALEYAHHLANIHLPSYINVVDYVINEQGHTLQTIRVPRNEKVALHIKTLNIQKNHILTAHKLDNSTYKTNFIKDNLLIDAAIDNRLMLFDPDNPLSYQIYLSLTTKFNLPYDWSLRSAYRINVNNNFSTLARVSNSVLPHVRSDALKYLQRGQNGLENLYMEKRSTLTSFPELHYRMFGGILEDMYSGIGAEVLYQPIHSRLAYGVSATWVKQRDYEAGFMHLDYQTLTAHASVFWATPFYNYDVALHAGRYLAKDLGATLELRRTFDNGWQIGMWATLTNVSSEEFGEGSFDKGMFFRIPFDSFFNSGKKSVSKTRIRPIQRDGGGRLEGFSGDMWWDIRDARSDIFMSREE